VAFCLATHCSPASRSCSPRRRRTASSSCAHIDDSAYTERYRKFENWFQHTQPIPGGFYLWIVEHLFIRNDLVHGELVVHGQRVDLSHIRCPLYLLAGAKDHITPPPQVFALAGFCSTSASAITHATAPGGTSGCSWATRPCAAAGRPFLPS
jgi:hypothetical protein